MRNNILLYDSNASTHLYEFTEYIIDYFKINEKVEDNYILLVNNKIFCRLNEFDRKLKLEVHPIDALQQSCFDAQSNILTRTLKEKKYLERFCKDHEVHQIVFLDIDAYMIIIGLWCLSTKHKLKISGILLSPYIQQPILNFRTFFKYYRKRLQLTLMLTYRNVSSILIFNDAKSVDALNKVIGLRKIFKYLPDPIKMRNYKKTNFRNKYNIPKESKIFLSIGGISKRKNIINIINSFDRIDDKFKSTTYLLILGRCQDIDLLSEISLLLKQKNNVKIIFDDNFLDVDAFESAVDDSDAIFVLYSDFYSSSGIIGNAAKHGKYLITSKNGVIGSMTRQYELGVAIDESSILEISDAVNSFCGKSIVPKKNEMLLKKHNYLLFVETLLKS